jgi:hypothetical protein
MLKTFSLTAILIKCFHGARTKFSFQNNELVEQILLYLKMDPNGMNPRIDHSKCEYIDEKSLPILVLATESDYDFAPGRSWRYIAHQTAGLACHQIYLLATILTPKGGVAEKMNQISERWLDSNCGALGTSLDEILEYRSQLNSLLGVDCDNSYRGFEEAIYPIDCTAQNLAKLTDEILPQNLDDLVVWPSDSDRYLGFIGRWKLYILGGNSD